MKESASVLLHDAAGKYLLNMRDNTPGIYCPLHWAFFGGGVEDGETAMEAARREMEEEIGIAADHRHMKLLFSLEINGVAEHIVDYSEPVEWGDFTVREGAGAGFFSVEDIGLIIATPVVRETFRLLQQ